MDIQVNFNDSEHPSLGTSRTVIQLELQKILSPACTSFQPTYPPNPTTHRDLLGTLLSKALFLLPNFHPP